MTDVSVQINVAGPSTAMLADKIEKAVQDGLMAIALNAQSYAQQSVLKGPKTGRLYKRGSVTHRASAPGEAPANDTGFLVQTIRAEPIEGEVAARLIADAPYAISLEKGTTKMEPRPFIGPAGEKASAEAPAILQAYMDAAL